MHRGIIFSQSLGIFDKCVLWESITPLVKGKCHFCFFFLLKMNTVTKLLYDNFMIFFLTFALIIV